MGAAREGGLGPRRRGRGLDERRCVRDAGARSLASTSTHALHSCRPCAVFARPRACLTAGFDQRAIYESKL